jgi:Mn2+/Fe2+ NRAMP family transporter
MCYYCYCGFKVLNGVLLLIFLVFILLLVNNQRLTKEVKNTRLYKWTTFAIITLAVAIMLLMHFLGLWGVKLFGS